jgi:hypothetical protein
VYFWSNLPSHNINNLCAFLNIVDTSRVKIVGVFSGSTTITPSIDPNFTDPSLPAISNLLSSNISSGSFASNMSDILGFASLIGASTIYPSIGDVDSGLTNIPSISCSNVG